jgi:hypothetical protein
LPFGNQEISSNETAQAGDQAAEQLVLVDQPSEDNLAINSRATYTEARG